jgi:hypothetical protein
MIKNMMLLPILLVFGVVNMNCSGNAVKSENVPDSMSSLILRFEQASERTLPYGSNFFMFDFPEITEHESYADEQTPADSAFTELSVFLLLEDNTDRLVVNVPESLARSVVDSSFTTFPDSVRSSGKNFELKVAKIPLFSESFKVLSVSYEGVDDTYRCEYPKNQVQNVLITINDQNEIIDKLLISFYDGNLDSRERFCYIDTQKIIRLKEFYSDELSVSFAGYKEYRISPEGKFIEIDTKK